MRAALLLWLWNLGQPAQTVFDEDHYTFDAVAYLGGGAFPLRQPWSVIKDDSTPEHPLGEAADRGRDRPAPAPAEWGWAMGAAAVIVAAAYVPVWLYLSVPVAWLRFLSLIPS